MTNKVENTSGLTPIEFKILVLPDLIADKIGSLYIPDQKKERDQFAQFKGTLIATGGRAFEDCGEPSPQVGDRIYFARYAGKPVDGADGKSYRLINDRDVSAVVTDEAVSFGTEKAA